MGTAKCEKSLDEQKSVIFETFAHFNALLPSGHYMYRQLNIKTFHVLPTQLYLCVLCGSQNKQPLFPYTTLTDWFV